MLLRGFGIVGPFVVMIYKMIHTDLLRFFAIYLVFLIGFSQGIIAIFRGDFVSYFAVDTVYKIQIKTVVDIRLRPQAGAAPW